MEQEKTDKQIIEELMTNVQKLHEENAHLAREVTRLTNYADELVTHSNMPCLPADLRNLRSTNLALATENEKLKTELYEFTERVSIFLEGF